MNITFEQLKKTHGEKAEEIFDKIARIGGWGEGREYRNTDGLDLSGLSDAKKEQVAKLLGTSEANSETDEIKILAAKPRPELEDLARTFDLDGNSYTNRTELAKAIVQAKTEKEGK